MKIKRKLAGLLAVVAAVTMLGACQANETSETSSAKEEYYIPVEDIEWSVDTGIVDGKRTICFEYTNNSEYSIVEIALKFTPKEDMSEEEQTVFGEFKDAYELEDDELEEVYAAADIDTITAPGDTTTGECGINGRYTIKDISHYNIMEPDILGVSYIASDNKIYTFYYDYKSEKYTKASSGDGVDAVEWSDSALASLIPQPEALVISISNDQDDYFSFYAYGISREYFKTYVESCKNSGFTEVSSSSDRSYYATNIDGYDLDLYYYDDDEKLYVSLDAPTE